MCHVLFDLCQWIDRLGGPTHTHETNQSISPAPIHTRELLTIGGRLAALEDRMAAVEKAIQVPGVDPR